jgi:hypothetical protein
MFSWILCHFSRSRQKCKIVILLCLECTWKDWRIPWWASNWRFKLGTSWTWVCSTATFLSSLVCCSFSQSLQKAGKNSCHLVTTDCVISLAMCNHPSVICLKLSNCARAVLWIIFHWTVFWQATSQHNLRHHFIKSDVLHQHGSLDVQREREMELLL